MIPSEAAKKARTCLMKCCSLSANESQSLVSWDRSISSAVQKDASCFLYISHICGYWMGNITQRRGFSTNRGSDFSSSMYSADTRLTVDLPEEAAGATTEPFSAAEAEAEAISEGAMSGTQQVVVLHG